jgi:GntR family transcriptional regulator of gluconate operon
MEVFTFTQIKQRNIEDEILGRLRDAIVSGQFMPGAYLNESEISKQMAISRIPIREVIKKLEQEGLVVRKPNKGVFVISFNAEDVREIFSLRARLECMAIEWAIPNVTANDIAQLRTLIEQQKVAIAAGKYEELARLDLHFHELICRKAGYARLLKIWYELHAQGQMLLNLRFRFMPDYTPETVPIDHNNILAAIESGDITRAVHLTNDISERVIRECIRTLAEFSPPE